MSVLLALFLVLVPALPARAEAPPEARALLRAMEDAFTAVADRVMPAVVNVSTVPRRSAAGSADPVPEPFREFFEEFRRRPPPARASGSGVIVDPNGYILTNHHVIENAADITVRLSDARKFTARLVGRDPKTDLAVLKVDAPAPLPVAELGDSDTLRVGQWAIAIGNPFGLDWTVTVGIISATARTRVGVAAYESFIQTDASINPGNSGGPLLNLDGKVVGINTAIVAAGQGIGFAIPITMAKEVMRQLIAGGRVVRGWLGVVIQDVTDELATSFGVAEREGVIVAQVLDESPAAAAGLRPGDVIVEFAGSRIFETPDLQRRAAAVPPGQVVPVTVLRDGQRLQLTVTVGEMPSDDVAVAADEPDEAWGIRIEPVTADLAQRFGVAPAGVVVTDVAPESPADGAGLRRHDIILEIDGRPVSDVTAFVRALRASAGAVRLYVFRPGPDPSRRFVMLEQPLTP